MARPKSERKNLITTRVRDDVYDEVVAIAEGNCQSEARASSELMELGALLVRTMRGMSAVSRFNLMQLMSNQTGMPTIH